MLFGRHFSSFKLCVRNFSEDYDTFKKTARHFCVALLIGNIHLKVSDGFLTNQKSLTFLIQHIFHTVEVQLSPFLPSLEFVMIFAVTSMKSELFRKTFFRSCFSCLLCAFSCCHERTLKSRFMWSQKRRVQFVFRCNSRFLRDRQIVTSYFSIVNVASIFQQYTKPTYQSKQSSNISKTYVGIRNISYTKLLSLVKLDVLYPNVRLGNIF